MITQKQLKEVLHYNPDTGVFTRIKYKGGKNKQGDEAGCINGLGYRTISINMKRYTAHRLAFLYMNGQFPIDCTDHINHIRHDNRWCNLRPASRSENSKNLSAYVNNKSGYTGIIFCERTKMWHAYIRISRKKLHLGSFNQIADAIDARKTAEAQYGYHPNHGK